MLSGDGRMPRRRRRSGRCKEPAESLPWCCHLPSCSVLVGSVPVLPAATTCFCRRRGADRGHILSPQGFYHRIPGVRRCRAGMLRMFFPVRPWFRRCRRAVLIKNNKGVRTDRDRTPPEMNAFAHFRMTVYVPESLPACSGEQFRTAENTKSGNTDRCFFLTGTL